MRFTRFKNFFLAGLLGVATGMPMSSHADDTEIFTGGGAGTGVRPNVLFILDTSGSMSSFDGESSDRLDRMKEALNGLLDNVDNVNIGLMRFTDPGGPVLFPVSGIDADANAIDSAGQVDINVRVSNDADDGEELVAPLASPVLGTVLLNGGYLEMGSTPGFGQERAMVAQIGAGVDDAEQAFDFYNNTSGTLEMVTTGTTRRRTTGYRFTGFPDDTDGATVVLSQLAFSSQSDRGGALDLKVFGVRNPQMPTFPGTGNGAGGCPAVGSASADIYCRLGLTGAADYSAGLAPGDIPTFQGGNFITNAVVDWNNVPDATTNEMIRSTDIAPVLHELFNLPAWDPVGANNAIGLFYTGTDASYRDIYSYDNSPSRSAVLTVDYLPAGTPAGTQLVALRFRDVKIPQGVKIDSASVELYAAGRSAEAVDIQVSAEKVADAAPFQAGSGLAAGDRLSGRLANSTAKAKWSISAAEVWEHEEAVQTPDITAVIQEVTDQGAWCGGNDIVVFLEYPAGGTLGSRRVHAHDSDPSLAATLRVDFDESALGAGQGCTTETITRQVSADKDDAEQDTSSGTTWLTSTTMEMTTTSTTVRDNGTIFRNVTIHPGATIESATIEFTSTRSHTAGDANITVQGELGRPIAQFESTSFNITNRVNGVGGTGTSATVTFPLPSVNVATDDPVLTADISTVVSELIGQGTWEYGDDMSFVFSGTGRVDLRTHDADPSKSALLRVQVRYNVGDVAAASPAVITVRQRLKEIVADLTHEGYTPIVDTLFEASRYFEGKGVMYGASRGDGGSSLERNTRLSHPGSYEQPPGFVNYPAGCNPDDTNLSDEACRTQTIGGNPNYLSPIEESCQANFIVLLTDGFANHNHSQALIPARTGEACDTTFSDGTAVDDGSLCGLDIVQFMQENDMSPGVAGLNNVTTYTIGFNISTQFLKDMAVAGNGRFYEAASAAQLTEVFKAIITDVLSRATSFAAPSLSVNAFNRLENRDEVYFSLFEPSASARWNGNIKRFRICDSTASNCGEVGDILDFRDILAVDADGRILDTALSYWSGAEDGPQVLKGGAGQKVPQHNNRTVYTYLGNGVTLTGNDSFSPPVALNELIDTNTDGIIDTLTGGTVADQETRTEDLLGMGGASDAAIRDHIDWIRGKDVDGQFAETVVPGAPENRWAFGDPLHANPLAITFGGTDAEPIVKLIANTNDGGIRLINTFNGVEEWVFYPPDMVGIQGELRNNPLTGKIYGMDGTPTPWIQDSGDFGVIDPDDGDFVRMFSGQRRGGNRYYGIQFDPPAGGVTDKTLTNEVQPKLLWSITGGTQEFALLGQSWSRPILATMLVGTNTSGEAIRKRVLIFGGGYEDDQDSSFGPASAVGNAIYVVDAETGDRIYVVGGPGAIAAHGLTNSDPGIKEVTKMVYPIPSDVAAFDSDGDRSVDRLYVGDVGGRVWRVDFLPDRRANIEGVTAVVGQLAELSEPASVPDQRKIFYPPTVVQVRGIGTSETGEYDYVGIVTGNRPSPLNKDVHDRFFGLRDRVLGRMDATDANSDGLSDAYQDPNTNDYPILADVVGDPTAVPPVAQDLRGEVLDVTAIDDPTSTDTDADKIIQQKFVASDGYYLKLEVTGAGTGEKGLAAPITLAGKVFFTTYLPEGVVSATTCSLAEGRGVLYGIDLLSSSAIFNWDNDPQGDLTRTDRTMTLGSGIPSSPVGVFLPEKIMLLIGVGGGAETVDPGIAPRGVRTYWFEEPPQ